MQVSQLGLIYRNRHQPEDAESSPGRQWEEEDTTHHPAQLGRTFPAALEREWARPWAAPPRDVQPRTGHRVQPRLREHICHTHTRKPQGPVMGTEVSVGLEGGTASGRRVSALGISTLTWLSHVCGPGEEALRISRPRIYVVKAETCGCFISPQISAMTQLANSPP